MPHFVPRQARPHSVRGGSIPIIMSERALLYSLVLELRGMTSVCLTCVAPRVGCRCFNSWFSIIVRKKKMSRILKMWGKNSLAGSFRTWFSTSREWKFDRELKDSEEVSGALA